MTIERDNCEERETRLDRMIAEFREAQTRRYMKASDTVVESQSPAKSTAPHTTTKPDSRSCPDCPGGQENTG